MEYLSLGGGDAYPKPVKPALRIALHEAGHAAMHVFLRMDNLDAVSIVRKGDSEGRCEIRPSAQLRYRGLWLRKRLFVLKAGAEGELLYPRARTASFRSDLYDHAIPILEELYGKRVMPEGLEYYNLVIGSRVRRLVRGSLREPITRFADVLRKRKTIDRYEAEELLCRLLKISPGDYWRLRSRTETK